MKSKLFSLSFATLLTLAGCSNGSTTQPEQTGSHGGAGSGGHSGSSQGGSSGTSGLGGTIGNGGSAVGGSTTSAGGSGGASDTGGKIGSGGAGNGSAAGNGGSSSTGGEWAGGSPGAGGLSAKGGVAGSGGIAGTGGEWAVGGLGAGGLSAKGGVTGSGGSSSTGGVFGSGGVGATGGSSTKDGGAGGVAGAGGGTTVTITASGYPAAGSSGQAKPSGTGTAVTVLAWAGFKGAVSFTFDDANSTQIDNYAALQKLNDKGNNALFTFYLQTGKTEASDKTWAQALKDGHELGNHTKSHLQTGTASDIDAAETFIKSTFGVTAYSLAAPYGDGSYATLAVGKFLTNRSAGNSGTWIAATSDPDKILSNPSVAQRYNLPCYIPATGAAASAIVSPVAEGTWAIILVHGFTANPQKDGAYQPVSITEFTSGVSSVKAKGTIWIDTVAKVSSYWIAGYKFSKLTATTSGSDKTWTWKTSDFSPTFPPGMYLRVKTDGGTLKQGGTVLQWDDHGYYEVSLDAGTLTLSAQ